MSDWPVMLQFVLMFFVLIMVHSAASEDTLNSSMTQGMSVLAQDMKDRFNFPNTYRESVYRGKLTPSCISYYQRLFVTKLVPLRKYTYFHEEESAASARRNMVDNGGVELDWRIVGGNQVDIRRAPYTVLYGLYCGGSLIAPEWVITAAHCKTNDNFIIAGSSSQFDGIRYPVCAHFLHPHWNKTDNLHFYDFDYQLLLLERPVPVTPSSRPIAIGIENDIRTGELITISGWGYTRAKQNQMQNIIRQVSVPIISHEVCQSIQHLHYNTITPRMFCAGKLLAGGKDSCQGDSGGPAVVNHKLVGLVSFGVGCAEPNRPGVYADVPLARPWIREITGLPL